ncbi:Protein of unknown function DUF3716 [Penicillium expansum]|uniref:Uncharacterized protein n=1 Tax=Penicillium expansum TaxID=27334 RepID=A0A0A2JLZ9_PENEN|nr:Protein of unknown function DUF3716 [Penicillium expansum]KGO42405.1 Protein of unknown function DUF3716 [Penicillium expansum]KGO56447.1 Protein of unknown function DUF3716 [Penicillium expansum]
MPNHATLPPSSVPDNPVTLSDPHVGPDEHAPGVWAAHVKTLPWITARKSTFIKSDFLGFLRTMEPRREPTLRTGSEWNAESFDKLVGSSISNAEGIYMQMVGRRAEEECTHCQQEEGPFPYCVVIDSPRWPKECANCHWGGNARQCSQFIEQSSQDPRPIVPHASFHQSAPSLDNQALVRQRASDRQLFLLELLRLHAMITDIRTTTTYTRQAANDNIAAWRSVRETVRVVRSRLSSGNAVHTSEVRRVRAQVLAGVGRGHTIQNAEQEVAQYTQDLQNAIEDVIRQYI